jgi:amidase
MTPVRVPRTSELRKLAAAHGFRLAPEEAAAFRSLLPALLEAVHALDGEDVPPAPAHGRDVRRVGRRPTRAEDPLNAIVRRCSVKRTDAGPLAGKCVGVKDNVSVAGVPMTCGSRLLRGHVPDTDATVVARLLDAGAEIVAVLNMDDCAFSGGGDTSAYGPTLNPHDPAYLAGGSSGGSAAALFYDDVDLTIGSDQGGSIRIPASWCGVVGLKPTHGLVPYTGIVGIDATIDHAGPLARTVAEAAALLEVIAGPDPLDPRQREVRVARYGDAVGRGVRGLRVGVLREGFGSDGAEPDVELAVRAAVDALGRAGATVAEVSVPAHRRAGPIAWAVLGEGLLTLLDADGLAFGAEGFHDLRLARTLAAAPRDELPATAKLAVLLGAWARRTRRGRLYGRAQNERRALRAAYDAVFADVDVLAMPTTPMKAHRRDAGRGGIHALVTHGWNMLANTTPFDLTGHPALSVPCGTSHGLPVGLMLVGRAWEEATLFAAGEAVAVATGEASAPARETSHG